jgi:hypothetical protein
MFSTSVFIVVSLLLVSVFVSHTGQIYSQSNTNDVIKNNTWKSNRDNLIISLELKPENTRN